MKTIKKHTPTLSKREGAAPRGFTLIELLVVVAIIAILSATILVALNSARSKAVAAKAQSELSDLRAQMELYYDSNGGYISSTDPSPTIRCSDGPFGGSGTDSAVTLITGIAKDTNATSSTNPMICLAEASDWAVSATLPGGQTWCVDSNGSSIGGKTAASVTQNGSTFYACQ